jgi:hypothetical protein
VKKILITLSCIFSTGAYAQSDTSAGKFDWLIPDGYVAAYAGGFGMFSAGGIYSLTKRFDAALTAGYVPERFGNIWTVNSIFTFNAARINLSGRFQANLLKAGVFLNLNFGDNIFLNWPEQYPSRYYWWNSALRLGPVLETEISYRMQPTGLRYTAFFQCLTNDMYLYSYIPNSRTLSLYDIIYFGTGIRVFLQ